MDIVKLMGLTVTDLRDLYRQHKLPGDSKALKKSALQGALREFFAGEKTGERPATAVPCDGGDGAGDCRGRLDDMGGEMSTTDANRVQAIANATLQQFHATEETEREIVVAAWMTWVAECRKQMLTECKQLQVQNHRQERTDAMLASMISEIQAKPGNTGKKETEPHIVSDDDEERAPPDGVLRLASYLKDDYALGRAKVAELMRATYGSPEKLKLMPEIQTFFSGGILEESLREKLSDVFFEEREALRNELRDAAENTRSDEHICGKAYLYDMVERMSHVTLRHRLKKWRNEECQTFRDPNHARTMEVLGKFWGSRERKRSRSNRSRSGSRSRRRGDRGDHGDRSRCFRCGKAGHRLSACRVPSDIVCNKCHKKGHKAAACRK
jgi:hypothetical protein